ncbi:MAG: 4-hydroxy-3-methylbut-2-enyl diphosphate reductase [Eubacteriales bacterium]|nr:4-hydroxy-3-methylbut-2-enyl diphosphate reductase [Eubacteriales bacterium]
MCEVVIAEHAGFCFGVRRAIDKAYAEEGRDRIYTYGSLIHNDEVMRDLAGRGIRQVDELKTFSSLAPGTVIIRSHGISEAEERFLGQCGHKLIDTTCPYVKKIHKIVRRASSAGKQVIIVGDRRHPEIRGICGWCRHTPFVVETPEEAAELPVGNGQKAVVVAQTTFNLLKYRKLVEIIRKREYDIDVLDTICQATEERQAATRSLARAADAMIVVGDRKSSNTRKLYEISVKECKDTFFVQTASDLEIEKLVGKKLVGITAGASAPKNIIEEVLYECQKCLLNKC